jgi:hypothetical protein
MQFPKADLLIRCDRVVCKREKAKSLTQLRATKQLREPLTQAEKDFNRNWEQQKPNADPMLSSPTAEFRFGSTF